MITPITAESLNHSEFLSMSEGLCLNEESNQQKKFFENTSVCRFMSQSYLLPSSGISIVWRADSLRRRHATPQLSTLPNDGDADNTKDS